MSTQPPPLQLSPVRFETPLRELPGPVVVESEDGSLTVVEVMGGDGKVRLSRADKADPIYLYGRGLSVELGELTVRELASRPTRAFSLPPGTMQVRHRTRLMLGVSFLVLAVIGLIIGVLVSPLADGLKVFLSVALFCLSIAVPVMTVKRNPASRKLYRSGGSTYPLDRLLDTRPAIVAAGVMVDRVKEEYGALLSDLCYRIEFPALFDPADPQARSLTTALIRWDTRQQGQLDSSELSALAADVRIAFDTAKAHAEAVGMSHFPTAVLPDAERALKTARLVKGGATLAERDAALRQVASILESLALYYLPSPTEARQMVEGRRVLALPGRLARPAEEERA